MVLLINGPIYSSCNELVNWLIKLFVTPLYTLLGQTTFFLTQIVYTFWLSWLFVQLFQYKSAFKSLESNDKFNFDKTEPLVSWFRFSSNNLDIASRSRPSPMHGKTFLFRAVILPENIELYSSTFTFSLTYTMRLLLTGAATSVAYHLIPIVASGDFFHNEVRQRDAVFS